MTKEELEQEAEEFVCSKKSFWKQGRTCVESVRQAYIASAEPREKRIAELEKENEELKAQHKMVCENLTNTHRNIRKQLTEAKEIIKYLLDFIRKEDYRTRWDINIQQAEDFLKENK